MRIIDFFETRREWAAYIHLQLDTRGIVAKAIKDGTLIPEPCAICGSKRSEAHHEDYTKPFEIVWLCPSHHMKLHGYEVRMRNRGFPITSDGKMRAMLGWEKQEVYRVRTDIKKFQKLRSKMIMNQGR